MIVAIVLAFVFLLLFVVLLVQVGRSNELLHALLGRQMGSARDQFAAPPSPSLGGRYSHDAGRYNAGRYGGTSGASSGCLMD